MRFTGVGDELCVRLPRIGWAIGQAEKERVVARASRPTFRWRFPSR